MIFSIAWKNVWRNSLRSSIVIASIVIGLVGGIFYLAFANGMIQQQISSAIKTATSNIQIHNPQFLINNEIKYIINKSDEKIERLKKIKEIEAISGRLTSPAMASSATTGTGIIIKGVNAELERNVSDLYSLVIDGDYFKTETRNPVVIGEKLAKKLKVKIKSKVVITIQNATGEIIYEAFRIVGIYKTHNSNFDLSNVFVLKKDLARVLGTRENEITEIAILLKHNVNTDSTASKLKEIFNSNISNKEIVIRTWKDIQPALKMMNDMTMQFTMIFIVIILVALSFGIINTMLMAIMERVREIGMLMAIGMSKIRIFYMILLETVFLSLTGGAIGITISFLIIEITGKTGIDLSAIADGLNSIGYSSFVYPELEVKYYILIVLLVIVTAIFASIMPARKALKFNPSQAVRHDA